MPQYNKAEIGTIAKQYGFVRDTFEKVLRLKEILIYTNTHKDLCKHLLLKGGTAINLTLFDLPRLSVDIDMDYVPNDSKDVMLETRKHITRLINIWKKKDIHCRLRRDLVIVWMRFIIIILMRVEIEI